MIYKLNTKKIYWLIILIAIIAVTLCSARMARRCLYFREQARWHAKQERLYSETLRRLNNIPQYRFNNNAISEKIIIELDNNNQICLFTSSYYNKKIIYHRLKKEKYNNLYLNIWKSFVDLPQDLRGR